MSRDWKLVKPQAWFDSPAIRLPDDPDTVAVSGRQVPGVPQGGEPQSDEEQQGGDDAQGDGDDGVETNPPPVVKPSGTTITPEGIRSSFEVTEEMLKDSNFETLEHITVRVWIEHQRRGDVEVEIVSPNGIRSVLARIRRFDEADTGFPGWKFMSLKHW
jgi:kexin